MRHELSATLDASAVHFRSSRRLALQWNRGDDERAKLAAAVSNEGCSGGRMESDHTKFEVEGAQCNDGRTYDLNFDTSYKLIYKRAWTQ